MADRIDKADALAGTGGFTFALKLRDRLAACLKHHGELNTRIEVDACHDALSRSQAHPEESLAGLDEALILMKVKIRSHRRVQARLARADEPRGVERCARAPRAG